MSDTYKLQLRHGAETRNFSTRDEVIGYINGQLQYGGVSLLPYEPILFFYGADDAKNAIIMVGLPEGKTQEGNSYFLVDTADLKKQIESLDSQYDDILQSLKDEDKKIWEAVEQESQDRGEKDAELEKAISDEAEARVKKDEELQEAIDFTKADLMSIIDACGLIYNEKLAEGRVSYTPDMHDEVIRDAKSVTEAIDKISKFVTNLGQDIKISTANTDTVNLTLTPNDKDGGNTLTAEVNIAGTEGLSKKNFDNNIIGKTAEGLYASASIEPSATNPNVLIFKTSGYIDGQFKVDAFETEVPLAAYKGDSGKNTGIAITVDADKNIISGELNLASGATNILKLEDGEYVVEGVAKNIKYKDTNVLNALNSQSARLDEIEDSIAFVKAVNVSGTETDTANITVEKSAKGDFTVSSDVRLSTDKSIIVADGGLKANISATFKKGTSTLLIEVGNNEYAIDLSDLAVSVLKSAEYDAGTEELVLGFIVGDATKTLRIPVGTLIHDVEVDDTDTINMTLRSASGGPNHISAEIRVDNSHSDNILTVNSNGVYVSKAIITEAVNDESKLREAADEELKSQIDETARLANANKEAIANETSTARAAEEAIATSVQTETNRATNVEQGLLEKISKNISDIQTVSAEVENIELRKEGDLSYALYVKGVKHGEFTIPQDQFVKEVTYDAEKKELVFVSVTSTGEVTTKVSISDLVNDYVAGEGLSLNGNAFSVDFTKVASVEKVDDLTSSLNSEIDRATAAELQLRTDIASNKNGIADNKNAIVYETGRATTAEAEIKGSITEVSGKVDSTKDLLTALINKESDRAKEAERVINERIDGQSQRISTVETNLSNSITEQSTQLQNAKDELTAEINKKANIVDVYTKEEILESLSAYAKTSDVQSKLDEKLNVTDAQNIYATKEALQTVKDNYATNEKVDGLNAQVSARLDNDEDAIDNFNLTYNEATSELAYTDKNGTVHTYKLYSGSLIKKGEFDPLSNSIVLTIENAGIESQITIPVSQLLSELSDKITANTNNIQKINEAIAKLAKDWEVKGSATVELSKDTVGEKDTLTASVRIASSNKQAIQATGDGLYVSNDLQDYTCVFGEEGTISAQTAISKLLKKTQTEGNDYDSRITENTNNIARLQSDVTTNTDDIATLKTDVQNLKDEVSNLGQIGDVSGLVDRVTTAEENINNLTTRVTTAEGNITVLTAQVTTAEGNITALTERVGQSESAIAEIRTTLAGHEERLTNMNRQIETLTELIEGLTGGGGDITALLAEINKIKAATGYDTYENSQTMSARLDEIEGNVGGNAAEINTIKTDMIGSKESPAEGSIWYELNNIIDAGMF